MAPADSCNSHSLESIRVESAILSSQGARLAAPWGVYLLYRRARRETQSFLRVAAANAAVLAEALATKRAKAPYSPGLELVYPSL